MNFLFLLVMILAVMLYSKWIDVNGLKMPKIFSKVCGLKFESYIVLAACMNLFGPQIR